MNTSIAGVPRWTWRVLCVTFFFAFLVFIDGETQSSRDIIKLSNIFALLLYAVPSYGICALLDRWFSQVSRYGFAWSLILGLPAGFLIMALVIGKAMGRI